VERLMKARREGEVLEPRVMVPEHTPLVQLGVEAADLEAQG
jgi:hypothetical protein